MASARAERLPGLPADARCVRLRPGHGTALARSVLSEREVYGVLGETKMCFHLFDLAHFAQAGEAKRLGPANGGRAQFRKNWFEDAPAASTPAAEAASTPAAPASTPAAPASTTPQRQKYALRKTHLPPQALIWAAHGGVDRYTGRPREYYASLQTPVHRDHVIEVQMLDTVLGAAFPWAGEPDAGAAEVAQEVLFPFLNGEGEFRKDLHNLNNTEDILNQYWKGGSVRVWRKHFEATGGEREELRRRLGGDASLAALLRASMRVDADGQTVQALAADKWKGRGARAQASYRPSWARAVDSAMGAAGRTLVERLREHDGQAPFLLVAEGLEDMLRKMELKGFTR
jgi:hypothetical protein